MPARTFVSAQREAQAAHFAREGVEAGYADAPWRLADKDRNLSPSIREVAVKYFRDKAIIRHGHAAHGLSSQVGCLNFLMPLAERPDVLSQVVVRALGVPPPRMREVETGPGGRPWFIAFEWTGGPGADFLEEAAAGSKLTRGANATSADAFVQFEGEGGPEKLLIEWKYMESYGAPLADRRSADGLSGGNLTRAERYQGKLFAPDGPVKPGLHPPGEPDRPLELEDFFWEPFYQLVRQQMLAFRMERATGERTRVLHLSPAGNTAVHKVTSKRIGAITGETGAFGAFTALLEPQPDGEPRFVDRRIEAVFGPVLATLPGDPWADYLINRYTFLQEPG